MATEIEVREAIAAKIQSVTPLAIVRPRDVAGDKDDDGWLGELQSPADSNRIRGWCVTLLSDICTEKRTGAAIYEFTHLIEQYFQYQTGDNANNSENAMSAERENVKTLFVNLFNSPLDDHDPIDFDLVRKYVIGGRQVHVAQGTIKTRTAINCLQ